MTATTELIRPLGAPTGQYKLTKRGVEVLVQEHEDGWSIIGSRSDRQPASGPWARPVWTPDPRGAFVAVIFRCTQEICQHNNGAGFYCNLPAGHPTGHDLERGGHDGYWRSVGQNKNYTSTAARLRDDEPPHERNCLGHADNVSRLAREILDTYKASA